MRLVPNENGYISKFSKYIHIQDIQGLLVNFDTRNISHMKLCNSKTDYNIKEKNTCGSDPALGTNRFDQPTVNLFSPSIYQPTA